MRNRYGVEVHWKVDSERGGKVRQAILHLTVEWGDENEIHTRRRRYKTEAVAKLRYLGLYRSARKLEATLSVIDAEHHARLQDILDRAAKVIGCERSLLQSDCDIRAAGREIWGYGMLRA